jgi:hypothetical protein
MKRFLTVAGALSLLAIAVFVPPSSPVHAQARVVSLVAGDRGHAALGLALRRLNVSGTFLETAAHPDDEHNSLFAMFTLGQGLRSVDVQTTRGEGGQNEIGPELFRDIGVLRTSELLAAHRLDGAEQWFTRAIDYGYSFDPAEIYAKWGREEVVGDFVREIRTHRPDVVLTMAMQGSGGDRAHEATSVLTQEAYRAAGDPARFPEQIKAGLRPWQPRKLYLPGGSGVVGGQRGGPEAAAGPQAVADPNVYDPLLGRTYEEIGSDARSNHKCQGMGQLRTLPGGIGGRQGFTRSNRYRLVETTLASQKGKDEASLFEGIDTSLSGLASFAGANPPESLKSGLAAIADQARLAQKAFDSGDDAATAAPVAAGLTALRALRAQLGSMGLSDSGRYEIDFRLKAKEADYRDALLLAAGVSFEAIADDGLVIGGQPVKVSLAVVNRGKADVGVSAVNIAGFDKPAGCSAGGVKAGAVFTCTADVQVPKDAKLTEPYWTDQYWDTRPPKAALNIFAPDVEFGVPFRPSPFRAAITVKVGNTEVTADLPVQYRYARDVFVGEKRTELDVVPAFSVKTTPETAVIPSAKAAAPGAKATERDIFVSVTNGTKGAAQATVTLAVPSGWTVTPASAPLSFANEDEALTARFKVSVPASVKVGEYEVHAVVTSAATGATKFDSGYQEIDYPHVERRQVVKPAHTDLKVIDVRTAPNLKVGYIVGAGDQVPPAIEQLGARVSFIQSDELAWGDLSKYDVIVTGVRAYLKRADLRAYNRRLIEFAERGGTVIVQYNKMEFNQAQFGPYPAKVGNGRVTDENAPVKVLVPGHPIFNFPNKITEATWNGWVQERGLYFLGEKDARYVDLVSMQDSAPDNPGVKLGALVDAKVGKGHWIYLGLGLWRQLPAQTEGAYQLLANLVSLSKAPAAPAKAAGAKGR